MKMVFSLVAMRQSSWFPGLRGDSIHHSCQSKTSVKQIFAPPSLSNQIWSSIVPLPRPLFILMRPGWKLFWNMPSLNGGWYPRCYPCDGGIWGLAVMSQCHRKAREQWQPGDADTELEQKRESGNPLTQLISATKEPLVLYWRISL